MRRNAAFTEDKLINFLTTGLIRFPLNVYVSLVVTNIIRAVVCDFKQCGILTCVDSDEPLQPETPNGVQSVA